MKKRQNEGGKRVNNVWLKVLGVMVAGSILKYFLINQVAVVAIDLVVLGAAYLILRRYPFIDLKRSMTFLSGLTVIVVMVDMGIVEGYVGNVGLLILLAWMYFNPGGKSKPPKQRHPWHK
jgi:hypothetical protein